MPRATRSVASNLAVALESASAGQHEASIPRLRRLAASLYLAPVEGKPELHHGIEALTLGLAARLDAEAWGKRGGRSQGMTKNYVPGLLARPLWPTEGFGLGVELERAAPVIRKEMGALQRQAEVWAPVGRHTLRTDHGLLRRGAWRDAVLFSSGRFHAECCALLPETCALIARHREVTTNPLGLALVSELGPGTEVLEHAGVSNAELTFHLGLRVPPGNVSGILVGGQEASWSEGKVLVFDDSFPHSVWHRGAPESVPRAVLLLRAWHPEVSPAERQVALHMLASGGEEEELVEEPWREEDLRQALESLRAKGAVGRWRALMTQAHSAIRGAGRQEGVRAEL